MKKYELTDITKEYKGKTLYRIRALKDFKGVKIGDLGGWVETENNLSQKGECWIYDDAICMDNARMYNNAEMHHNTKMYDNSIMYNNSKIYHNSTMHNNSKMYDCSKMYDYSAMYNYSAMYDNTIISDRSRMYNDAKMHNNAKIYDNSVMYDKSKLFDNSRMRNNSIMYDNSAMYGCGALNGNAELHDTETLHGELVSKVEKYIDIANPKGRIVTGILKNGEILFNVGCQQEITKETFIDRIYNEDGGIEKHPYRKEYLKIIDMIELYLKNFKI